MDDKLLSYGDCLLRVRDVALLTGPHWLNDAVMSFFFEYLRSEGAQPDEPHADRVVLVDASLSFLVANVSPDEARAVLAPLGVSRAHMALFLVRHARVRGSNVFQPRSTLNARNLSLTSDRPRTRDPGPASVPRRSTTTTTSPSPAEARTGASSRTCVTRTRARTSTAREAATTPPPRDWPRRSPTR